MTPTTEAASSRLARRLGFGDAVVIGLGSMLGAGVFAAFAPAAAAAGPGLLLGLVVAGLVAACNATASARLARRYPASGGTYIYGRARLGLVWGYTAGWAFVAGKTASCAAMALTFAAHVAPDAERPVAAAAVVALTAVNYRGASKTAAVTRVLVLLVMAGLVTAAVAMYGGGELSAGRLTPLWPLGGPLDVLRAAGFLFFAFVGYARVATLGEEVRDPARTIPRAIGLALALTLAIYAVLAIGALLAGGAGLLAAAEAPLVAVAEAGTLASLTPVIRTAAAVATLSVLLALLAGVSRTAFAMAANGDLPRPLDAVHPRYRVPHHAELVVGAFVLVAVLLFDLRGAIGFSSVLVLIYYALANASAFTLAPGPLGTLRACAVVGVAGCLAVAVTLPEESVWAALGVLGAGLVWWAWLRARAQRAG